ncbi:MAG: glutathione S-transferase N-terminal domain-containing protein [Gammaproteobacteria bacterium]|nr:glutathione S-transferase N-terminal domain-containing protein [Gammaproteobacteria bacterium]
MINLFTSTLSSSLRGFAGIRSSAESKQPEKLLRLYDIENCPYCRLVREALTELNLDALILPCPKAGVRFRPEAIRLGGKAQFPFLVDDNTDTEMYESLDIVRYLYATYGSGELPLKWRLGRLQTVSSSLASGARLSRGIKARPSREAPASPLELFSFEASPFARPVRELLCQLELSYVLRSCGRTELAEWLPPTLREAFDIEPESKLANRRDLQAREGKMGIPYLYDVNTDTGLFESEQIIEYLILEYAA